MRTTAGMTLGLDFFGSGGDVGFDLGGIERTQARMDASQQAVELLPPAGLVSAQALGQVVGGKPRAFGFLVEQEVFC